jgi:predicted dehydrogenase
VRLGVIGCGRIAQEVHIPNYIGNQKAQLEALCDVDESLLRNVASDYHIEHTFNDYEEMLNSGLVEAVSVCVPTFLHSKVVIDAARHGIHVLCEKPLASNMGEADAMLESVTRNGIKFMVGFNRRFLPNHVKAKEYLEKGKIGEPIAARVETINAGPYAHATDISAYKEEAERRMGCLFDSGSHLADMLLWIFGKPSEVSAFANYREGVAVDDCAVASIKFETGVVGSICVAWANLPDFKAIERSRIIEIIGTKGLLESDCFGPSLYFYSPDSLMCRLRGKIRMTPRIFDPNIPQEALRWSYAQEIDQFLRSIIENRESPVPGVEAKEALRLILAAYESIRAKSKISLAA